MSTLFEYQKKLLKDINEAFESIRNNEYENILESITNINKCLQKVEDIQDIYKEKYGFEDFKYVIKRFEI